MRKVLIIQPTEIVSTTEIREISEYINKAVEEGVVILNKNITYEVIEINE